MAARQSGEIWIDDPAPVRAQDLLRWIEREPIGWRQRISRSIGSGWGIREGPIRMRGIGSG